MRLLVVEDDPKISRFLVQGLRLEGHEVDSVDHGDRALEVASSGDFDLILLDLTLPGMDGLEVLERLRVLKVKSLVVALTARDEIEDRVRGLDAGADDYLTKPFSFAELTARIRALQRRQEGEPKPQIESGPFRIDLLKREARYEERLLDLTPREFQLLSYLVKNTGEIQTRAMLADRVWGYNFDTGTNVVDVYINYLRGKLGPEARDRIRTVRGLGYVLEHPEAT